MTTDYNGAKVKESDYYYDGDTATGTVSKGNLTKQEDWKSGSSYVNLQKAYGEFGLLTQELDPRESTTTYRYDAYKLYPASSANALGYTSSFYYDYTLGKPATTTDPNGHSFATVYDGLDRVTEIKQPDLATPTILVTKTQYTYTDTGSRNIKETQHLNSATSTDLYRYLDGFNRTIQERREAEYSNEFSVRDYVYDKRGLLSTESIPYFSTGSATTPATTSASMLIYRRYDPLGRPASTSDTFGVTTITYDQWVATTTDPLGFTKGIEKDAFGNILRVHEATTTYVGTPTIPGAENTFYPTSGANAPMDGDVHCDWCAENSWNEIHNASTGDGNDGGTRNEIYVGASTDASDYYIYRTILNFNTGSTLDGGTVASATLGLWINSKSVDYDSSNGYLVVAHFTGSTSTPANSDYSKYDGLVSSITKQSATTSLALISASATTTFTLNSIGRGNINTTAGGYTQFGIVTGRDSDNSDIGSPNHHQNLGLGSADGNRPASLWVKLADTGGGASTTAIIATTAYEYNRLGNLTKITDALGNVRNFTYDGLGRRLTAEDLHASGDATYGTWTYNYDDAGNLSTQVDPKSQTVNFTYDVLNRVTAEDYTGQTATELQYSYDSCTNGIGRLCSATTTDATTLYSYNAAGGIATETQKVGTSTLVTAYTYDRQGNPTLITYPDNAKTRYLYNDAGLLEKIAYKNNNDSGFTQIVSGFNYNPDGQVTVIDYSNGVHSTSTYDILAHWRLTNRTTRFISQTETIGQLALAYDPWENIALSPADVKGHLAFADDAPLLPPELSIRYDFSHHIALADTLSFLSSDPSVAEETPATTTIKTRTIAPSAEAIRQLTEGREFLLERSPRDPGNELVDMRTRTSKTWMAEYGFLSDFRRPLHYQDNGQWVDIDLNTEDRGTHFANKANQIASKFPKTAAEPFESLYQGLGSRITFRNVASVTPRIIGGGFDGYGRPLDSNVFIYENAYPGIDIVSYVRWWGVETDLVVKWATSTDSVEFELEPVGLTLANFSSTTERALELKSGDTVVSQIRRFHTWDRERERDSFVSYSEEAGRGIFRITVDKRNAVYPIVIDPSQDFSPSTGSTDPSDGRVETNVDRAFSTNRNRTTADDASYTVSTAYSPFFNAGASGRIMGRSVLNFATGSTIPVASSITSAVLKQDVNSKEDTNGTRSYAAVVHYTGSTGAIGTGDYDQYEMADGTQTVTTGKAFKKGSSDSDLGSISVGLNEFTLNATGTNWIAIGSGTTSLGLALGHDIEEVDYTSNDSLNVDFADGTTDPVLSVTWNVGTPQTVSSIQDLTYSYDQVGNITRILDATATTGRIAVFDYDELYRLQSASTTYASTSPDYKLTWSYNRIGNISTSTSPGDYSYEGDTGSRYENPHAPTTIGTMSLTYDRNGNLGTTTQGNSTTVFSWNHRNQLTQVASGTATTTFGYDHTGQRVFLRTPTGTTTYANQHFNQLNATTTKHIYAGRELIATIVGNGVSTSTYFIHTDHLGGTAVLTNASGSVVEVTDFYPYGSARLDTGSYSDQRKAFGHEYDVSSGLTYMGARYYTGNRGQFLSQDPAFLAVGGPTLRSITQHDLQQYLSDPQQLNAYAYARANPLSYRDQDGRFALPVIAVYLARGFIVNAGVNLYGQYLRDVYTNIDNAGGRVSVGSFVPRYDSLSGYGRALADAVPEAVLGTVGGALAKAGRYSQLVGSSLGVGVADTLNAVREQYANKPLDFDAVGNALYSGITSGVTNYLGGKLVGSVQGRQPTLGSYKFFTGAKITNEAKAGATSGGFRAAAPSYESVIAGLQQVVNSLRDLVSNYQERK